MSFSYFVVHALQLVQPYVGRPLVGEDCRPGQDILHDELM